MHTKKTKKRLERTKKRITDLNAEKNTKNAHILPHTYKTKKDYIKCTHTHSLSTHTHTHIHIIPHITSGADTPTTSSATSACQSCSKKNT